METFKTREEFIESVAQTVRYDPDGSSMTAWNVWKQLEDEGPDGLPPPRLKTESLDPEGLAVSLLWERFPHTVELEVNGLHQMAGVVCRKADDRALRSCSYAAYRIGYPLPERVIAMLQTVCEEEK